MQKNVAAKFICQASNNIMGSRLTGAENHRGGMHKINSPRDGNICFCAIEQHKAAKNKHSVDISRIINKIKQFGPRTPNFIIVQDKNNLFISFLGNSIAIKNQRHRQSLHKQMSFGVFR